MRALSAWLAFVLAVGAVPGVAFGAEAKGEDDEALEAMAARVQAVFDRLAEVVVPRHAEVAEYTIEPVVEKVPNAWINQNNEIYVTSGLLELLEDDDALAGVIGHEIAHGTQGHIPHRINQSLWSAFAVITLGTIASTQGGSDWGGLLHMRDLFMYAFSREQESEADVVGMRYARDAGYRADGLVEALKAMDDERRRLPQDSVWQELYRTHPPMSRRITDLRLLLATERLHQPVSTSNGFRIDGFGGLGGGSGPGSDGRAVVPEEAAAGFLRALLAGDKAGLRPYVLPGRAGDMLGSHRANGSGGAVSGGLDGSDVAGTDGVVDMGGMNNMDDLDGNSSDDAAPSVSWAKAELEVLERQDRAFSAELVVRLWRRATKAELGAGLGEGLDGEEISSPVFRLSLQQGVRGWVVTAWESIDEPVDAQSPSCCLQAVGARGPLRDALRR